LRISLAGKLEVGKEVVLQRSGVSECLTPEGEVRRMEGGGEEKEIDREPRLKVRTGEKLDCLRRTESVVFSISATQALLIIFANHTKGEAKSSVVLVLDAQSVKPSQATLDGSNIELRLYVRECFGHFRTLLTEVTIAIELD
jgi:hypothetical protein